MTTESPPKPQAMMKSSGVPVLPSTTVVGIFGGKGSGKSLYAAMLANRQYLRSDRQRPILYFPDTYNHVNGSAISLEEMFTGSDRINNAIIIWDEAQVLLSKFRAMSHANRSLLGFLQQIRKRGCHLYYTSNAPKQLDRALGEQTDWHCYCDFKEDKRCKRDPRRKRMHSPRKCRDMMWVNWVDTQGARGIDNRYRDGRWRSRLIVKNLSDYYGWLYNTFATASVNEVAQMNAEAINRAHQLKSSKVAFPELVERMREWITDLVITENAKWLVPGTFAKKIAEQTDGEITPSATVVGMACSELGLVKRRRGQGSRYELPDKMDVQRGLWQAGLA